MTVARSSRVASEPQDENPECGVSIREANGVLEVGLGRPPANEIGLAMLADLETVVERFHRARKVRALLIHSSLPNAFSAGADLLELHRGLEEVEDASSLMTRARGVFRSHRAALAALKPALRAERSIPLRSRAKAWFVRGFLDRIHAVLNAIDAAPIPVVAAVHGVCFGGGFELALTADVIVADKSARFAFPELRLGLIPGFGGLPRLEREVPNATIRDLLLTGRSINAKRAHELGLVAHLVREGEALKSARRVCKQMTRFDRTTLRAAKSFVKEVPYRRLAQEKDLFCRLLMRPTVAEALGDFASRTDVLPYLPS